MRRAAFLEMEAYAAAARAEAMEAEVRTDPRGEMPGRGPAGRGRRGGAVATVTALGQPIEPYASDRSRLVLRFVCESRTPNKDYIEQQVFEVLRKAPLPNETKPAFTEVQMLGEVIDVYRDNKTLQLLDGPGPDILRFAAFEGYGVVNVGPAGEPVDESAATTGRRSRRSGR